MNISGINSVLISSGYIAMDSNVPFIKFFSKSNKENDEIKIVGCIDNAAKESLTTEQLDNIQFQVERKFLLSGIRNVNIIFLIYSDNVERDKRYCDGKSKFWIIDTVAWRIIIFENQDEEFDDLRKKIEIMFNNMKINDAHIKSTEHDYKKWPWITMCLIGINIAYYIILELMGSTENVIFMLKHGALYYVNFFDKHEYYRIITCMFMHFGFAHLLNNMISLFFLGNEAEKFYGRTRYILIYFISGILGSFASVIYYKYTSGVAVSAGASGAIYGILGALVVKVVEDKRKNMTSLRKIVFLILVLMIVGRGSGNVDNIAHLGGFISGMICGIISLCGMNKEKAY